MQTSRPRDSRREILAILCTARRTVPDLAAELGISTQAVRKSLARLEEDGLVRYERVRRDAKKPVHEYWITPQGVLSLSRAYLPLLQRLLYAQEAQYSEEVEDLLRSAGRRLAPSGARPEGDLFSRAEAGAAILRDFGAIASPVEEDGRTMIRCACCAIGAIVLDHPLSCKGMEAMLAEFLGIGVQEHCDRRGRPSCRFVLEP